MAAHDALGPVGVAGADGGDELEVVLDAAVHRVLVEGAVGAHQDGAVHQAGDDLLQAGAVRQRQQPVVEVAVVAVDRVEVARATVRRPRRVGHREGQAVQLVDVVVGRAQGGCSRRHALGVRPQHEDGVEVGRAVLDDPGAAVGGQLDQAVGGEPAQRLTHGGPAHAELLGQAQLAQSPTRAVPAAEDVRAQHLHGAVRRHGHGRPSSGVCAR